MQVPCHQQQSGADHRAQHEGDQQDGVVHDGVAEDGRLVDAEQAGNERCLGNSLDALGFALETHQREGHGIACTAHDAVAEHQEHGEELQGLASGSQCGVCSVSSDVRHHQNGEDHAGAVDTKEPAQLCQCDDQEHTRSGSEEVDRDRQCNSDQGRQGQGAARNSRDDQGDAVPDDDVHSHGDDGIEGICDSFGHSIGQLDGPVVVDDELADGHRAQTNDDSHEQATCAQFTQIQSVKGGSNAAICCQSGSRDRRRDHQNVTDQRSDNGLHLVHLLAFCKVPGHGEGHEEAHQAHGQLIGHIECLIGCTGSIPAEHCANSTDDLDDGTDHDQAHGSAHAAGDGGKDLVGGQFLAANLQFFHERTLGKAFNCAFFLVCHEKILLLNRCVNRRTGMASFSVFLFLAKNVCTGRLTCLPFSRAAQ